MSSRIFIARTFDNYFVETNIRRQVIFTKSLSNRRNPPEEGFSVAAGAAANEDAARPGQSGSTGGAQMDQKTFDKGLEVRQAVLGQEYVQNSLRNADEFNKPFQELVTEYCWGAVWGRE